MGSAIIDAIKSGLGLIADLAEQFLTGFTTLFWDPTLNSGAGGLTAFGTFAMVLLGISITLGCISLVMSVITRNSGAN